MNRKARRTADRVDVEDLGSTMVPTKGENLCAGRFLDATTPESVVDDECRRMGLDPENIAKEGAAFVATQHHPDILECIIEEEVAFHVDFWESMGKLVRDTWIQWAKSQTDVDKHPSWLVPWDDLPERDKEVDRRIAKRLFEAYDNAAIDALGKIAKMCGCPDWEYPAQVVRDVERELENRRPGS
jgi:hypothetical protein